MKKDITLVNFNSNPIICRVVSFRNNILNKFFEEIVYKHNEKRNLENMFSTESSQFYKIA